jgi:hypothetical protein
MNLKDEVRERDGMPTDGGVRTDVFRLSRA